MTRYPYAARLNSFLTRPELAWPGRAERPTTLDLIDRAATVRGLSAVDVNFPQQAEGLETARHPRRASTSAGSCSTATPCATAATPPSAPAPSRTPTPRSASAPST